MTTPRTPRATRWIGLAAVVSIGVLLVLGLVVSPPDVNQGQLVRLIYVHPACATYCYIAFGLCALASLAYLWPRTRSRRWDQLAGASAEVGVVLCVATLVSGSIWGRASWGVWWTWDARLTLTALLLMVFLGYLALRRSGGEIESRARRSAVTALCCFVVVPIDHEATSWWSTLHQGDTIFRVGQSPLIHGWQLTTTLFSFVTFGLVFAWILIHRLAVEAMEDHLETEGYVSAIAERRAEGIGSPAPAVPGPAVPGPAVSGAATPAGVGVAVRADAADPVLAGERRPG
jgi:heme exporter protein C